QQYRPPTKGYQHVCDDQVGEEAEVEVFQVFYC
ncbi:MAG: hypothetical protein ACI8YQ_002712, partial [Polaribacter sp.]